MTLRRIVLISCVLLGLATDASAEFSLPEGRVRGPDAPGSLNGLEASFDVSPATGALAYSLPLRLPPADLDVDPGLALAWSANAGNGPLGLGWMLRVPSLCRTVDAGYPNWAEGAVDEAFVWSGPWGGRLVPTERPGTWGLEVEELPVRARLDPGTNTWLVETPDGARWELGGTTPSREGPSPEQATGTACWYPTRIADAMDRRVELAWRSDGGRSYLDRVTLRPDWATPATLDFVYESRPDAHVDLHFGTPRRTAERLARIEVAAGGRALHRWSFGYEEVGNASRLVEVELRGADGAAEPVQRFTWGPVGLDQPRTFTLSNAPRVDPANAAWRLIDLDGDGLPDMLRASSGPWEVARNDHGVAFEGSRIVEGSPSFDGATADWTWMDLDGDGRQDVVLRTSAAVGGVRWWRNVSEPGAPRFEDAGELDVAVPVALGDPRALWMDVNGDRRTDLVVVLDGRLHVMMSQVEVDRSGRPRAGARPQWAPLRPVDATGGSGVAGWDEVAVGSGLRTADVNGDGVVDLVRVRGGTTVTAVEVHDAIGGGRFGPGRALLDARAASEWDDVPVAALQLMDVDGDGLADLYAVVGSELRVALQELGRGVAPARRFPLPDAGVFRIGLADVDGNGRVDFFAVAADASTWTAFDLVGRDDAGLMVAAENGAGAVHRFVWSASAAVARDARDRGEPWRRWMPASMPLAVEHRVELRGGESQSTVHRYLDPVWDRERGVFRAFRAARVEVDYGTCGDAVMTDLLFLAGEPGEEGGLAGWLDDAEPRPLPALADLAGRTRISATVDGAGRLHSARIEGYRVVDLEPGRWGVRATESLTLETAGTVRPPSLRDEDALAWQQALEAVPVEDRARVRTLERHEHDRWGQRTRHEQRGYVDARGRSLSPDAVVRTWRYADAGTRNRYEVVCEDETVGADGELLRRERRFYDGDQEPLGPCVVERGALRRVEMWLDDASRWVRRSDVDVDRWGRPVVSRGPAGEVSRLVWPDDHHAEVPVQEERVDPARPDVRFVSRAELDPAWGQPTWIVDDAGVEQTMTWDDLGRLRASAFPQSGRDEPHLSWSYRVADGWSIRESRAWSDPVTGAQEVTWQVIDGLGRERGRAVGRVPVAGMAPERMRFEGWVDFCRDEELAAEFGAFVSGGELAPAWRPPEHARRMSWTYDVEGRPLRLTLATGEAVSFSHAPGRVVRRMEGAPGSGWTERVRTAFGRTEEERYLDDDGTVVQRTRWAWDGVGQLRAQQTGDVEPTRFGWDTLGRRSTVQAPGTGAIVRTWNDADAVVSQQMPEGTTVFWDRDVFGRLLSVRERDASSQERVLASLHYDRPVSGFPANHALGRLTSMRVGDVEQHYDYDPFGHLSRRYTVLDGRWVVEGFSYDADGSLLGYRHPDGSVMRSERDDLGLPTRLAGIVDEIERDAGLRVTGLAYANGMRQSWVLDDLGRELERQVTAVTGEALEHIESLYDARGMLEQRIDHVDGHGRFSREMRYEHDAAFRLVRAEGPALGDLAYAYDTAGRLQRRRVATLNADGSAGTPRDLALRFGSATERGGGELQPVGAGDASMRWDDAGRLVARTTEAGQRSYTWDGLSRLRRVQGESGEAVHWTWGPEGEPLLETHDNAQGVRTMRRLHLSPDATLIEVGGRWLLEKSIALGAEMPLATVISEFVPWREAAEAALEPPVAPWSMGTWFRGSEEPQPPGGGPPPAPMGPGWIWVVVALFALLGRWVASGGRRSVSGIRGWVTGPVRGAVRVLVPVATALAVVLSPIACGPADMGPPPEGSASDTGDAGEDAYDPGFGDAPDVGRSGRIEWSVAPPLGTTAVRFGPDGAVTFRMQTDPMGQVVATEGDAGVVAPQVGAGSLDLTTGLARMGARFYDAALGVFLSPDAAAMWGTPGEEVGAGDANPWAYVGYRVTFAVDLDGWSGRGWSIHGSVALNFLVGSYTAEIAYTPRSSAKLGIAHGVSWSAFSGLGVQLDVFGMYNTGAKISGDPVSFRMQITVPVLGGLIQVGGFIEFAFDRDMTTLVSVSVGLTANAGINSRTLAMIRKMLGDSPAARGVVTGANFLSKLDVSSHLFASGLCGRTRSCDYAKHAISSFATNHVNELFKVVERAFAGAAGFL